MTRPTIRDLAAAAEVSVATVNRVIGGSGKVREATMARVLEAAREIGFYGVGALEQRIDAASQRHRLGVIVQTPHRQFSTMLARSFEAVAPGIQEGDVRLRIAHLDDLSPESVAAQMQALAADSDALAVLAAEHPIVTDMIDRLAIEGVPTVALISPLAARSKVGYVGLDSWKVGRTAAWTFEHACKQPGKLGLLVGTHRYRCHDLYESGFRSYLREHAVEFTLLEPMSTFESDAIARELTEKLLRQHPDLRGLYVSGGGIGGALAAIRESGRAGGLVTVGHDLMATTKAGLLDGSLTLVISHPFERVAREAILAMIRARNATSDAGTQSVLVPLELYARENI